MLLSSLVEWGTLAGTPTPGTFQYIWVVRGTGTRSVEYSMLPELRSFPLFPLLEVTDVNFFPAYAPPLRRYFGALLVDLPYYLLDYSNKHRDDVAALHSHYPDPATFFTSFTQWINIPVASGRLSPAPDYSLQLRTLQQLQTHFPRIAARLLLPSSEITQIPVSDSSYANLIASIPQGSIILLDAPFVLGNENVVAFNVREMANRAIQRGHEVYVLNAFDPEAGGHNFGPHFSYQYSLRGFGDLATEPRWPPPGGGGAPTGVIRYYDFDRFTTSVFRAPGGYAQAVTNLTNSSLWQNHAAHRHNCRVCTEVASGLHSLSPGYWKRFRIEHYITSIFNETRNRYASVRSAEDLDPDGHDVIVRQSHIP
jgi:hypothetical protein